MASLFAIDCSFRACLWGAVAGPANTGIFHFVQDDDFDATGKTWIELQIFDPRSSNFEDYGHDEGAAAG